MLTGRTSEIMKLFVHHTGLLNSLVWHVAHVNKLRAKLNLRGISDDDIDAFLVQNSKATENAIKARQINERNETGRFCKER
jgi:SOS response regulatory protein OraA/RecX